MRFGYGESRPITVLARIIVGLTIVAIRPLCMATGIPRKTNGNGDDPEA
jgi:hypothetical protein